MRSNIFIDRAALLNIAIEYSKNGIIPQQSILLSSYKRVLFETNGMSALIYTLEKIQELSPKFVTIKIDEINKYKKFEHSLNGVINNLSENINVKHAFKSFCRKSNQEESNIQETIKYLFRMIFVSTKYDTDILMWEPRFQLLSEVLYFLGFNDQIKEIEKKITFNVDFSLLEKWMPFEDISSIKLHLFFDQIIDNNSVDFKDMISKNKQHKLLRILLKDDKYFEYNNELTILLGNLNEIKRKDLIQAISRDELVKRINLINLSILNIIDSIQN